MTADEAVAKARAGTRGPPAPRTDGRGRNHDNRPDVSVHSQSTPFPFPMLIPFALDIAHYLALFWIRSADEDYSYEAILLKPGEKKIEEEVDTRELHTTVDRKRAAQLTTYHRPPLCLDLHLQKGRSHPGQHASLASAEDRARPLRGLQGKLTLSCLTASCKLTVTLQMPHPLKAEFLLRVQTDGEITPRVAVCNACRALITDWGIISREFQKEYELRKMANAANKQQNGTEPAAPQQAADQQAAVNPQV